MSRSMGIDQGSSEFRRNKDGFVSLEAKLHQAREQRDQVIAELNRRAARKRRDRS